MGGVLEERTRGFMWVGARGAGTEEDGLTY